jgi:hypothetical protein
MAQKDVTMRQMLIVKYLKTRPRTFKEIEYQLQIDSEVFDVDLNEGIRTFQRDKKDILELYGVQIDINKSSGKYEIIHSDTDNKTERIIESFNTFNILNATEHISKYIIFEDRKAEGTHYIMDIITGIKNKKVLEVHHQKYWETGKSIRLLEPLAVKEYQYRWYLVAKDRKDNKIKTFGLDRVFDIIQTKDSYEYPEDFDKDEYFENSYGMIYSSNKPEDIELSFTHLQGKYIKSLPMHHSQKELVDNKDEYRISLQLIPTEHDFMRDLLHFGNSVKVIKPKWLANKIKNMHQDAIDQYS